MTEFAALGKQDLPQNVDRHVLFLQGLPGPFFRRLAKKLEAAQVRVSRVNFNGGDVLDWRGGGASNFRSSPDDWPRWLGDYVQSESVTEIVLFGDCRPPHRDARHVAASLGIPVHVFEEGYLRPDYVTLERGGVNSNSNLPLSLEQYRQLDAFIKPLEQCVRIKSSFGRRAREAIRYNAASVIFSPVFPHFRSHRPLRVGQEAAAWILRWLKRGHEEKASRRVLLELGEKPFFLFPLQLDGDAQISHHSPFASMGEATESVLRSFAQSAPDGLHLLVKRHPFDPDVDHWRNRIEQLAQSLGVRDRIFYIERGALEPLLDRAAAVVTINSTVGPLALEKSVPVLALGEAIYAMPGLTAESPLDQFWQQPGHVDLANFELFRRVIVSNSLINGGFHSAAGLDLLVSNASERLLSETLTATV